MARYSIEDTTLTALGDAVRSKVGETEIRDFTYMSKIYFVDDSHDAPANPFTIPVCGATKIKMKRIGGEGSAVIYGKEGTGTQSLFPSTTEEEVILNRFGTDGYAYIYFSDPATYEFEATWYDADGNQMEVTIAEEVKKTMTPERMATEIDEMLVMNPSLLEWSGDLNYKDYRGAWDGFVEAYGDSITTKDVVSVNSAFLNSKLTRIPFEFNFGRHASTAYANDCSGFVTDMKELREVPIFNNFLAGDLQNMFSGCLRLREFPEGYGEDWDWTWHTTRTGQYNGYKNGMFNNCYSLRRLPMALFKYSNPNLTSNYDQFRDMICLYALDKATGFPCPNKMAMSSTGYSGLFYQMFKNWSRCEWLTFASDVGPMKWAKQTIDLSQYFGWVQTASHILSYNSGITADKQVTDFATYEALANDPDWWTLDVGYSRYNLTSAISTINSLPDCSEYTASQGANTIKFKGSAGSKTSTTWVNGKPLDTQNGAISNLTDEHIAVAAAKGWTVAIV